MAQQRKKIGDLLIEKGYISHDQLEEGLRAQAATGKRLGSILVESGLITEDQLLETISERLGIPRVTLDSLVVDPNVIRLVGVEVARRYTLIPVFAMGNTLTLAMADPLNFIAIDEIKYQTGRDVKRAIARSSEILRAIDQYYSVADSVSRIVGDGDSERAGKDDEALTTIAGEADSPAVKLVNLIIERAVKDRASDIHIEPDESTLRIRYRIAGAMRDEASPPKSLQSEIISRIKVSADLDVSEKRVPQDGRFMVVVEDAPIDIRVSTLPTIHGEKLVLRILDRRNLFVSFQQLGFSEPVGDAWQNIIRKPEGLILICGPTSSGKTSTLYTSIQEINSIEKNIFTVEDPVEYSLPMVNQVQINERAGLTFPAALRALLRQNPDVIMIGEIRDRETAQMAIRSSLTGHLVLSTIHTNDAPSAITRLIDMGIEPYLVAGALTAVLGQRLVRLNCPNCAKPYQPAEPILRRAGLDPQRVDGFKRGAGCQTCRHSGYTGQTGVFEYMAVTTTISEMVMTGASLNTIREEARRNGYQTLFEAGMDKVRAGEISLEELLNETSQLDIPQPSSPVGVRSTIHAGSV